MKIAVTGASGFIGKRFVELAQSQFNIISLSLKNKNINLIDLSGVDAIVHLAGKAHDMGKINDQDFFDINYTLTKELAKIAILNKVPHFIYVSTVKVYGDETNMVLNENSPCNPTDAYGKSKLQAEGFLQSKSSQIDVAIVRPPLVYGAGVKGNMLRLLHLSNKKIPLPFGNIANKRTIVYNDNVVALIAAIINQKAKGIFIPADEKPLSTDAVLTLIKNELGNKKKLITIPGAIKKLIKVTKPGLYNRLFGSFEIDNTLTNKSLNFKPPYTTAAGIANMVTWFKTLQINS